MYMPAVYGPAFLTLLRELLLLVSVQRVRH
jgi:hypothetical protein